MILPFLAGIFAVTTMLIGNTLYALLDQILKNRIPVSIIARLIVFNIPSLIVLTLPVGVALASSLAVNRMSRDSEITPIRIIGIPLRRIFLPIFLVGLTASVFSFWMSEQVVPEAQAEFQKTQSALLGYALTASPTLVSNRVFKYQNYSFYVHEAARGVAGKPDALLVKGVMIFEDPSGTDKFPHLITADSAIYENGLWSLRNVVVHLLDSNGFTTTEARAGAMTLDLRIPMPTVSDAGSGFAGQPDQFTMEELASQIRVLEHTGQDATALEVAYYFKLALPFLCFAFALCAPPLSLRFSRTGSFMGVFLCIVMVFVAWNTLLLTKALGLSGNMPPLLAAWTPDLLFAGLGVFFLWRAE